LEFQAHRELRQDTDVQRRQSASGLPDDKYLFTVRIFKAMKKEVKKTEEFHTVEFFRDVKRRMAKATKGMTLEEMKEYWRLMREGKVILP
jgi:hypothetical protein